MPVDAEVKIVTHIYALNQPAAVPLKVANPPLQKYPVLLLPVSLEHLAAVSGPTTVNSAALADCKARADALVNDHFPHGYSLAAQVEYQGHMWKEDRWVPIPGGGQEFGYAFAIMRTTSQGTAALFQDMKFEVAAGPPPVLQTIRAQFYLVIQKA